MSKKPKSARTMRSDGRSAGQSMGDFKRAQRFLEGRQRLLVKLKKRDPELRK
jgi:hypothetical protein